MLLSKSCEYGIRAVLYLVVIGDGGYVPIRKISDNLGISFHFLTKIFQRLTEAGVLSSFKGPRGGVQLARPAGSITIRDLVTAIDGDDLFKECILGLPGCGVEHPCPVHAQWSPQRAQLEATFTTTTLDMLAEDANRLGLRLASNAEDAPTTRL